jgi:divalent metal cation (Fe/Co/Zn/Cd) transporter
MMARVRDTARAVPGVVGVDKAYARKTGLQYHVDLHVEVDPALTVGQAHDIGGHVRSRVREELDWVADVLVHVEPAGADHTTETQPCMCGVMTRASGAGAACPP